MSPFVVFALPRSRTAWLARFLSYGNWYCGHEELRHCRTLEDVSRWFSQPFTGTVETAGAPWWRLLGRYAPKARIVVIRRPLEEVVDSLMRLDGLSFDRQVLMRNMWLLDRKLAQIAARIPGVLSVNFEDLAEEAVCASIFEHCTGQSHDHSHWEALAPVNIQIDMRAMMRYALAYAPALNRLGLAAKQQVLASMGHHKPVAPSGISFQTEPFDVWMRDGEALFREHCIGVGEDPDQWRRKNIPMMRHLDAQGGLQIMTARSNGRMFGYLVTVIGPSLASENVLCGSNTTFFASPEFPGLGLKLQRAALQSLKDRGVNEVFFEAGKRGSGERLGTLYRRLGATDHGQVFRLALGA